MQGEGEVTVTTRSRSDHSGALFVEIGVEDKGPGVAPDLLKHLFVPFFTTKPRGTGLGLAISQRMVQAMGGRIEVTSELGQGAVFTILLPAFGSANRPPPRVESGLNETRPPATPAKAPVALASKVLRARS